MKKLLIVVLLFVTVSLGAQNIQLLSNGNLNFATLEIYKPFNHGALYYFSDMKMDKDGFREIYTEISGYHNIYKKLSVTAQYNAGINKDFLVYPVYLCGLSYVFTFNDHFSLSVDATYRHQNYLYIPSEEKTNGYQITPSFVLDYRKFQASGYCDFWNSRYYVLEPQAWYKLFKTLWIGAEWRMSNYSDVLDYDMNGYYMGNYANYIMGGIKWNM